MSILGFVFLLLLLLSLERASRFYEISNASLVKKTGAGYLEAHNVALEKQVKAHFAKSPGTQVLPTPKKRSSERKGSNKKKKKSSPFCSCSKMDVSFFLTKKNLSLDPSFLLFKRLISKVYAPLFEEVEVDTFLEELHLCLLEKGTSSFSWENLQMSSEQTQLILYRMLKGTKFYEPSTTNGFPSILKLISIKKEDLLCLPCISFEMLEALFGSFSAKALWDTKEEEQDLLSITEEKLKAIVGKDSPYLEKLLFSHKNKREERHFSGKSKKTEVQVTWKKA